MCYISGRAWRGIGKWAKTLTIDGGREGVLEGWNRPKRGLLACWEEGGFFYFLSQDFSSEDNTKTKSKLETKHRWIQPMSAQNYLEVFFRKR